MRGQQQKKDMQNFAPGPGDDPSQRRYQITPEQKKQAKKLADHLDKELIKYAQKELDGQLHIAVLIKAMETVNFYYEHRQELRKAQLKQKGELSHQGYVQAKTLAKKHDLEEEVRKPVDDDIARSEQKADQVKRTRKNN